eukprot:scaffold172223_cov23-Cyclotella_meneghiniana.AAC.1
MGGRGAEVVSGFDRAEPPPTPIESENDDLRCLWVVFTRAQTVLAVGGRMEMESSRSHNNAASTASKQISKATAT